MERWEVFGKRTVDDPWTSVGAVHAPDDEMALLLAKEAFFRHGEGVDFAVVRLADMHVFGRPDLLAFATDKSYKLQSGYTGMGDKRRRAATRAQEAGAVIDRPRPADKRVPNPAHRRRGGTAGSGAEAGKGRGGD
jgi:ring-1,2-phenylacetyl-CoA epoxidase subunit PaaB